MEHNCYRQEARYRYYERQKGVMRMLLHGSHGPSAANVRISVLDDGMGILAS